MSTTKPVIKAKTTAPATTGTTASAPTTNATGTTTSNSATSASSVAHKETVQKPKLTKMQAPPSSGRTGRAPGPGPVPVRQEYLEPEDDVDEGDEDFDDYNQDGYDMEQMEAMREYENQRMAEVFTQVLATVFTYENITLPETILTLSQALEAHNKTQEGILQALNKIADKLSK